jgi:hypothetical protein
MVNRTAIYTCITDGYNILRPHPEIDGVDWIAFVDQDTPSLGWNVHRVQPPVGMTPRRVAKHFKMRPDVVLPEYDRSIWIDGTVRVDSPTFAEEAMSWTSGSGIAMFIHPERDDIWDEADVSLTMPKYQDERIISQVAYYFSQGLPRHSGLWCGGIIARQHTDLVRQLGEMWLGEVDKWSIQDQLSLPFCLRELGIIPGGFPASLYNNPWLTVTGHNPNQ